LGVSDFLKIAGIFPIFKMATLKTQKFTYFNSFWALGATNNPYKCFSGDGHVGLKLIIKGTWTIGE
jgi:hypothetical protein